MSSLYIIADGGAIQDVHNLRRTQGWPSLDLLKVPSFLAEKTGREITKERSLLVSTNVGTLVTFHHKMETEWKILALPIEAVIQPQSDLSVFTKLRMHAMVSYLLGQLAGTAEEEDAKIVVVGCDPNYVPCVMHARKYVDVSMAWWKNHLPSSTEMFVRTADIECIDLADGKESRDLEGILSVTDSFLN